MSEGNVFKKVIRACAAVAILGILGGCRTPAPVSITTAVPAQVSIPSPTHEDGLRRVGLTSEEVATLDSLEKVDAYPLYTMHYQGDYDVHATLLPEHRWINMVKPVEPEKAWSPAWACSLFAAMGDTQDMSFGRNFDWRYSPALLLFTDPTDGYAAVSMVDIDYLGFGGEGAKGLLDLPLSERTALLEAPYLPFDGMNETGLVVGMAAVPFGEMSRDPSKKTMDSLLVMRVILDQASTVDEAVAILERYNIDWGGGPPLHYLIADSSGGSVLVEFYEGEMVILPNQNPWQGATNFLQSPVGPNLSGMCWRYDRLSQRLKEVGGELDPVDAMELLSEVSQESTQWSVIYEINGREVYVVMGRKYGQIRTFSLPSMGD